MTMQASVEGDAVKRARIYFVMALALLATAFIGFLPTFWAPMTRSQFVPSASVGIHAMIAFSWLLLFTAQTWLIVTRRTRPHRALGLLGISLATLMTVFGVLASINMVHRAELAHGLDAGLTFMIVPLSGIFLFALFVTLAIVNIPRPEWHKRFMFVATAQAIGAAVVRPFIYFLGFQGHMPVPVGLPSPPPPVDLFAIDEGLSDLFLLVPMIYDWRTRGRPHPAYLIGFAAVVGLQLLKQSISATVAWHDFAAWVYSLAH